MRCSVRTWLSSPAIVFDAAMFACDEARGYRCASVSAVSGSRRHVGHSPTHSPTCRREKAAFGWTVADPTLEMEDRVGRAADPAFGPARAREGKRFAGGWLRCQHAFASNVPVCVHRQT